MADLLIAPNHGLIKELLKESSINKKHLLGENVTSVSPQSTLSRHCIQHSRFTKQDGWRLDDLSYNLGGIISVTSYNNDSHQTSIDLYSVRNSVDRDKPKIHFTKDFEQYSSGGVLLRLRSVALVCDNTLVSCLGNILEVVRLNEDMVVISRTVNEKSRCLAVRKEEIFMGFYQSNKINIYDLKELLEIRSIVLQGLRNDVYPFDMAVTADKILVCLRDLSKITEDFPRVIEEKNGKTLHEFTRPKVVHSYARSVTACAQLGIVAVLWSESLFYVVGNLNTIEFYSLFSNNNSSFLTFEIDSGFSRIRVSDKGDMMITGNMDSGEVQIYYMEDLISYNNLKKFVSSQLQREECVRLAMFFSLSKEVLHIIEKCDTPAEIFLLALEGKDIIQASNVERLTIAFRELNMPSSHSQVTEFYQKTRRSPCVDETTCDLKEPVALTRDQAANAPDLASSITEEDLITYGNLKKKLILQLKKEECLTLAAFFSFTKQETENIEMSDTPVELLLLALEDKGVLQESNVNNLTEAFHKLEMPSSCIQVIEFYHKTMTYDDAMSDLTEPLILINDQSGEKAADSTEPESDTTEEDLITYGNLKKKLTLQLKKEVCLMLAAFFSFTKEETEKIEMSDTPVELLLLALEDKGVLQESNVNNLTEAFHKLEMPSSCIQMIEFYQKTMTYDDAMSDLTESFMLMKDQSKEEAADSTEPESDTTETTWTRHMAPDGRTYYVNSVTKQATWENPHNLQSHAEALREREEMYLNLSKNASDFLHESSFEGELAKLSVRVSENLTKANCMKLATYFNFPVSKMDLIQNDNETPGLTLFAVMKERHVINIHNVMALKEALEELKLIDISDTLVIPYQRKIDRLRFEQGYLSPQ